MKIRFAPLSYEKPLASDRRRGLRFMHFLRDKGKDSGLYQEGGEFDVLIIANRDFKRWLRLVEFKNDRQVIIFDVTDNILQSQFATHLDAPHRLGSIKRFIKAIIARQRSSQYAEEFWKKCDGIVTGSKEQAELFRTYNEHVIDIVDPVDLAEYNKIKIHQNQLLPTVVWEGTADNLPYLKVCAKPLSSLVGEGVIGFRVITDRYRNCPYEGTKDNKKLMKKMGLKGEFVEWEIGTFANELAFGDIGIAPLPSNDPFAFSKPANKILGYMAIGLPVVASGIPAYKEILNQGEFGFIAQSELDWYQAIRRLAEDPCLRRKMGESGRSFVLKQYTLAHYAEKYMRFVKECFDRKDIDQDIL